MSPETRELQCIVEEQAMRFLLVRSEEHRVALEMAWTDFLEALYADWHRGKAAA